MEENERDKIEKQWREDRTVDELGHGKLFGSNEN